MKARPSVEKRRKERARQDRKREKAERRDKRRQERGAKASEAQDPDYDPDIAHIVPGPQPLPEEFRDEPEDADGADDKAGTAKEKSQAGSS